MRYDNSLTSNVQDYIANTLARKVSAAQERWEISSAARDIRSYLCDPTTLNTPDFVIRRFIQANHSELLPQNAGIPNLLTTGNVPWDKETLDYLAKKLTILSKNCGANISKAEWGRYLDGKSARDREKVFQIAFALNLDVDSTIDLLLAFDMEAYSVRYPLDLVCSFCQRTPGKYTWSEAEEMLAEFLQGRIPQTTECSSPTQGMTRQISCDIDAIFAESLPEADTKAALVKYMIENAGEFISYKETVCRAIRGADGKTIKGEDNRAIKEKIEEEVFLHGYSTSRMDKFMRLAEYLAILYPDYLIIDEITPERNVLKETEYSADGAPSLSFLARSMFLNNEWRNIVWGENKANDLSADELENHMRTLCQNYEQHMMKIERLRKGGNNIAFFERRDALLFIYFLVNGYIKLGSSNKEKARRAYDVIDEMLNCGNDFDYAIAEALEKAEYVFQYADDENRVADRFKILIESFNLILTQLDYMNLYLPARFDRFVVLALLSENPDELTPLIMSQEELGYYESET